MADFYTYRNEVAGRRRKRRLFLILIVVTVLNMKIQTEDWEV